MKIVTIDQKREMERLSDVSGVPYYRLMKNAGTALGKEIEKIINFDKTKKILFLCGKGNNGGDCYVAAEYLYSCGYKPEVSLVCGEPATEISKKAFDDLDGIKVLYEPDMIRNEIRKSDVIVDGVFGIGFKGEIDRDISDLFMINEDAVKIAVDIPSGGNGNTGTVAKVCFKADYTITFSYIKFGMTQYPLKSYCGKTIVVDVGIPEKCCECSPEILYTDEKIISETLFERIADSHKGTYGTLVCVTGSVSMPGAAMLSGEAALRCGCGLVKICAPNQNIPAMASRIPEAVYLPATVDKNGFYEVDNFQKIISSCEDAGALLIGCGIGVTYQTKELVEKLLRKAECPIILDADGINCIINNIDIIGEAKNKVIITPHPAEMARILDCSTFQVQKDRLAACRKILSMFENVVVVLKGAGTIIATHDKIYVNDTGNPGMSCGGTGDVLSGMIASFAAQGITPHDAAALGVYMHGRAGDIAAEKYSMHYMLSSDVIKCLPELFLKNEKILN